ncbi:hypothetical protein C440_04943 [Haloferax mucosum ATCC BAA-1512]|uniref:Uncharacterized protein n=1 Tax=Haloferax mucosum ATCC BAA-1512 TaxID=662479 RepID=M0II65_9EURY|nr:hypothetical protein [Haloferax mucosum]ELZ96466.1 hypothetical protein C440_04943 [Haloferax mucosum ATCC BAA-1512]
MVIPLLYPIAKAIVGFVSDFAVPLIGLASAVYLADRYGVIDVAAILNDLFNQYLDPSLLTDVLGVIV